MELDTMLVYAKTSKTCLISVMQYIGLFDSFITDINYYFVKFNIDFSCVICKRLSANLNKFNVCEFCKCNICDGSFDTNKISIVQAPQVCEICSCVACALGPSFASGTSVNYIGNHGFKCAKCEITYSCFHRVRKTNKDLLCLKCCTSLNINIMTLPYIDLHQRNHFMIQFLTSLD